MQHNIHLLPYFLCTFLFSTQPLQAFEYGDPNSLEQENLELINRARANPLKEAQRLGIDLFAGAPINTISSNPSQPLSFNAELLGTARLHSRDMLNQNYFTHASKLGLSPFDRMRAANYNFQTASENMAARGNEGDINNVKTSASLHDDLFIDKDYPDRGHRVGILNPIMREVGIGIVFGMWNYGGQYNAGLLTSDFGVKKNSCPIILGVVYSDDNQNQFYNAGEGLAGVDVSIAGKSSTKTASAGGFGLEVPAFNNYTVTFTHPEYGSIQKSVQINDANVKVDALLSEFPFYNKATASFSANTVQQCTTLDEAKIAIPCINAGGDVYEVTLSSANTGNDVDFGIQSINLKKLSSALSCATYDAAAGTAHLGCFRMKNQNYRAELRLKAHPDKPIFELSILNTLF